LFFIISSIDFTFAIKTVFSIDYEILFWNLIEIFFSPVFIAKDLKSVLRILQTTEPSIKCDNDENIEIDFEILKPETLIALRKFVSSCMLNNIPKKNKCKNFNQ